MNSENEKCIIELLDILFPRLLYSRTKNDADKLILIVSMVHEKKGNVIALYHKKLCLQTYACNLSAFVWIHYIQIHFALSDISLEISVVLDSQVGLKAKKTIQNCTISISLNH